MRVREHGVVEGCGIGRQGLVVAVAELVGALKNPAVDEQALSRGFQQIFRSGYRSCGAAKGEFSHKRVIVQNPTRSATSLSKGVEGKAIITFDGIGARDCGALVATIG